MRTAAMVLALSLLAGTAQAAAPPCGPGSTRLLEVVKGERAPGQRPPIVTVDTYEALWVCRDRHAVHTRTVAANVLFVTPFVEVARAAPAAAYETLLQALEEFRVGTQATCVTDQPVGTRVIEVTWYGRGERRNSFQIQTNIAGSTPACSADALALRDAIEDYAASLAATPGAEVHRTSE